MKKIEQIFENLHDTERVIDALGKLDVESVNKYWMGSGLQQPKKGEESDQADIKRLLLMAFGPEGSMPSLQRFGPRLRTCIDYNDTYRYHEDQQFFDPPGVLSMSTAYQRIPLGYFPALFQRLGIVKVRITVSAFETHFSDGKIGWMKGSRHLELKFIRDRCLDHIPNDIGILTDLETIQISYTNITGVPDSFFELGNLTSIDLSDNKIKTLQDDFSRLRNLNFLDISENKLKKIPDSIGNHDSLKDYRIHGNPLREISDAMAFNTYRLHHDDKEKRDMGEYPKDVFIINDTWLDIPHSRIGEIIDRHGIRKLKVESAEMLERILEPDAARHFASITSLDLRWKQWVYYGYDEGFVGYQTRFKSNFHNDNSRIRVLPETIRNLPNLEELDLSNCQLSSLPDGLFDLTRLKRLRLGFRWNDVGYTSEALSSLPDRFDSFKELEELDLSAQDFEELPESLFRLVKLKSLALNSNSLSDIGDELGNLVNLERLDLSSTGLSSLPGSIVKLGRLRLLKLDFLNNLGFPEEITELTELRELSMSNTGINEIPESISRLAQLEVLDLPNNGIESVPPAIAGLKRLKRLNLEQNKITRLDEAIGECGQLEELIFNSNRELQGLPDSIGKLKKLQVMDLWGCKTLSFLPDVFQNLTRLSIFKFTDGKITAIPETLYECRSLRELQIFGIPITTIDNRVSNFVNLERLDLRMTGIVSLPAEIGSLKKLKELQLSILTEPLPESISGLGELEELDVDFKGVEHPFPKSIGGLKSLSQLSVNAKGGNALPEGFGELQSLKRICLRDFDFGVMPIQICGLKGLLSLDMAESNINEIPLENLTLHSLKFLTLSKNPISDSSTWKKKLKACLPGTSITWKWK